MSRQISFYQKNFLDFEFESVGISATQGDEFISQVRSRSLSNGWGSTDSVDADLTTIEVDLADQRLSDHIMLLDHNFKDIEIERFDDLTSTWEPWIELNGIDQDTTFIPFPERLVRQFRIIILGTQEPDQPKRLSRLVCTKELGQFEHFPKIENVEHNRLVNVREVISGKGSVIRQAGRFQFSLTIPVWKQLKDFELIERLFRQVEGFEVSISSGDGSQFRFGAKGYRPKDLYLMTLVNNYSPEFLEGIYVNGLDLDLNFLEVVT